MNHISTFTQKPIGGHETFTLKFHLTTKFKVETIETVQDTIGYLTNMDSKCYFDNIN